MSILPPVDSPIATAVLNDQFVVSYGKSASIGVFTAQQDWPIRRGDAVVVRTPRGIEQGTVLVPATIRQARILGASVAGELLRPWTEKDARALDQIRNLAHLVLHEAQTRIREAAMPVTVLDVDFLFADPCIILQFVGIPDEDQLSALADDLQEKFACQVRFENLSLPKSHDDHAHGCGKPDCGKSEGSGCSTCSTGGGCSSCGSGSIDLRPYFAHLRSEMEQKRRPLN